MTDFTAPSRVHTPVSLVAEAIRRACLGIRFRIAAAEIRRAVAAGDIAEDEGRERLAELRERTAAGRGQTGF